MPAPRLPFTDEVKAMVQAGRRPAQIAKALDVTRNAVYSAVQRLRDGGELPAWEPDTNASLGAIDRSGTRCRCGLRLPCDDCLPRDAATFAALRMVHP